jgi:hypothetical protein
MILLVQSEAREALKEGRKGPSSPFEEVKMGGGEGWWNPGEQARMQRMQEQERQRAMQLHHTRAWAEAQVAFHARPNCVLAMPRPILNHKPYSLYPTVLFGHTASQHEKI